MGNADWWKYFSMFVYIRARFCSALIGGNLTAHSRGSHGGIGGGIQIPESQWQALLPFSARQPERPGELARRVVLHKYKALNTHSRRNQ